MISEKLKSTTKDMLESNRRIRWAILLAVTLLFLIILYPNLIIIENQYKLGDVAERDIKAPQDFLIEDLAATEAQRRMAISAVRTIYDYDPDMAITLSRNVEQAFTEQRAVIAFDTGKSPADPLNYDETALNPRRRETDSLISPSRKMKEHFEEAIRFQLSNGAYQILVANAFSEDLLKIISDILTQVMAKGVVSNKELLLREIDKGIILKDVATKTESVVHNLNQFNDIYQAKIMARKVGQPLVEALDFPLQNVVINLAQESIQPNITLNRSETQERKKEAAAGVKPVLIKIKAGEMLLREGERVTDVQLQKLNTLQALTKKGQSVLSSIGIAMLLVCLLVTTYILHLNRPGQASGSQNKNLLFIASICLTFFLLAEVGDSLARLWSQTAPLALPVSSILFGVPLSAGAMIVCLFLGLRIAIPSAMVMAICFGIIFQNQFELFLYFLINSTMAAYWIQGCRERRVFMTAGAKIGLLNVVLVTAIDLYTAEYSGSRLLWDWAFAFMGGIGAGIVTAGILPLVEMAFGYTSDITLLELANLDRRILRRLMIEAPGTYHHSVIVASMVEAAASEINANPLLAKVCAYYHDIGKIKKPLYFIENQSNGRNKHDRLAPSMSALILIAHIKNGVEIARENKLGQEIIDTIKQHHGTSLIKYFYEKAKLLKGEDRVKIDDFRYPGPKPQTKEVGLVMLADVVEAASRTLENPTPSRIQGMVQHLINNIFSDGQLDACELTLKDLHKIAKSFNKILNGIHHHRIEYLEKRQAINGLEKGKLKNGGSDRKQAKKTHDAPEEDQKDGPGHLRRLGLS